MNWQSSGLANLIKLKANNKSLLTQADNGQITKELEDSITCISTGICNTHNTWQNGVRVGNVIANGGGGSPGGPIGGAIGIGPISIFSQKFKAKDISDAINGQWVPSNHYKLTDEHTQLNVAIGKGFEKAWNLWIDTTGIQNILVNGGSCSHTYVSPGSLSGAIGFLPTLQGNLTQKVNKDLLIMTMINECGDLLTQADSGRPTDELQAYINAIGEGLMDYQDQWLTATQMQNMLVNGGMTMAGSGTLSGGQGSQGQLV